MGGRRNGEDKNVIDITGQNSVLLEKPVLFHLTKIKSR